VAAGSVGGSFLYIHVIFRPTPAPLSLKQGRDRARRPHGVLGFLVKFAKS
jgi:hypothetical protein